MLNNFQSLRERLMNKRKDGSIDSLSNENLDSFEKYRKMRLYYRAAGTYNNVARAANDQGVWVEVMKPLRMVTHRSVEFYVSKTLPGVRVSMDNEALREAIEKFMFWSNYKAVKSSNLRECALTGDLFVKVLGNKERVWQESIKPEYVTDFSVDGRGFITEIRIDVPIESESGSSMMYTEYWSQAEGYFAAWRHYGTSKSSLSALGSPVSFAYLPEMGIDFVPIVHTKFKDVGELRGYACTEHALDKIDEVNRQATELHRILFRYNKPKMAALSENKDAQGKPLPPPSFTQEAKDNFWNENDITRLPGGTRLESLIPNIRYADALAILNAQMEELEQDLPELNYYKATEKSQASGRALAIILAPAIDRALEFRENIIQGQVRANKMALTIGIFMGLFPASLGKFNSGDFEHSLVADKMFGETPTEMAQVVKDLVGAGVPVRGAMKIADFEDSEIQDAFSDPVSVNP